MTVLRFTAAVTRQCEQCPAVVWAGQKAAWLADLDLLVCAACGDAAERAVAR